jgi:hypothetical protein
VNFDLVSWTESELDQEFACFRSLIPLQLNDFAVFVVFDHCSITGEFLLEATKNSFLVELLINALERDTFDKRRHRGHSYLNGSQCLSPVALLNTDVYEVRVPLITGSTSRCNTRSLRISHIGKRIC